jgi:hypothetical protein
VRSLAGILQQDLSRTGTWLGVPALLTWVALWKTGVARARPSLEPAATAVESGATAAAGELAARRS